MFFIGFIVGVICTLILIKYFGPKMMIQVAESPYPFEKTVEEIKSRLGEMGWNIPVIHDFCENLKNAKGIDIGPLKVIEFCKADYGMEVLKNDDTKFMSAFMPCGIGVFEKRNGKTYVAKRNMKLFSIMFGGKLGAILRKVAEEEEKITGFLKR